MGAAVTIPIGIKLKTSDREQTERKGTEWQP